MNRFHQLQELFDALRDLSPAERDSRLDAEEPEAALASAVRRLLQNHDSAAQPLEHQPWLSAALDSPLSADPDTVIGGFRIVHTIGTGGMGVVYLAEQAEPKRTVALKVIRQSALSSDLMRRFRFEASVLAQLKHPGIAHVYETGIDETHSAAGTQGRPYFAMEFVDGVPIHRYVKERSTREVLKVFALVCDAVEHAHQAGFIHRDLKPANILVDRSGQPKVLDFGVARAANPDWETETMVTHAGQLVGTLPYMSPEQVLGDPAKLDHRCDVFSLGVILYELLAQRLPLDLRGKSLLEASRAIVEEEPTHLSSLETNLRGDIATIVAKALERSPSTLPIRSRLGGRSPSPPP